MLHVEAYGHRGISAQSGAAESDRVELARLLVVAALRGVRPGSISCQLGLPYEPLQRGMNSAWRRWVGALAAEPDPFVGTIFRQDPDQRWSTAGPTQFHLATGSGFARRGRHRRRASDPRGPQARVAPPSAADRAASTAGL